MCLICKLTDAEAFGLSYEILRLDGFEPCVAAQGREAVKDGVAVGHFMALVSIVDGDLPVVVSAAERLTTELATKYDRISVNLEAVG